MIARTRPSKTGSQVRSGNGGKPEYLVHRHKRKSKEARFEWKMSRPWKTSKRFIQLPRLIIADKQLSHGAVRLAAVLSTFDMSKKHLRKTGGRDRRMNKYATEGIVYPGNETLARAMGVSESRVIAYKRELEEAGYLEERRRFSKTSLHVMKFPRMESIENVVRKFHVFAIPLSADDFEGIVDPPFMEELRHFFKLVKEAKEKYRLQVEEQGKRFKKNYTVLEKTALGWYLDDLDEHRKGQQNNVTSRDGRTSGNLTIKL